jgi:hypothetical protein
MPKTKISEFSATPANNTDIDSINIAENCPPSGINDAIRELMAQLKDWQSGTSNDPYVVGSSGSLTLNQGTANTVPYLNGSKVVTSGSALTFDGSLLGVSGASTSGFVTPIVAKNPSSNAASGSKIGFDGGGTVWGEVGASYNSNDPYLGFYVRTGSEKMRISDAGNLGLGVTPSAWSSTWRALDVDTRTAIISAGNKTSIFANNAVFESAGWKYKASQFAGSYAISTTTGNHEWSTAASGTAGNAITFTQAMTLDASGNLLVGTTSATYSASGRGLVEINGSSTSLLALKTGGNAAGYVYHDGTDMSVVNTKAGSLQLTTNGTERARIDSSGRLLVGTTSAGLSNSNSTSNQFDGNGRVITINHAGGPSGSLYMQFGYGGTQIGSITVATSSSVAYNSTSDYRLKNTIAPMTGALAKVALLKPCTYKWNADGSDGEGFIAHELAEVVPHAVTGEKDAVETYTDEDGNEQTRPKYQGIDTSFLVATLTAAIKEQQALIETLTQRITTLEAK